MFQSKTMYCCNLSAATSTDIKNIQSFSVLQQEGQGLAKYLRSYAMADEANNVNRTYLVKDKQTNELIGYFSLKAGMVSNNETRYGDKAEFDTTPGIELSNFALNGSYLSAHPSSRGCGRMIFDSFIREAFNEASNIIGAKVLYIFALPVEKLINNYQTYGFKRLDQESEELLHSRLKPRYDKSCVFMYLLP